MSLKGRKFRTFLTALAAGLVTLAVLPCAASAQSQTDDQGSVAEAARRAREQKKNAKPVRTLTNDDLPPASPALEGQPAAAPVEQANPQDQTTGPAKTGEKAVATEKSTKQQAGDEEKRAERKAELEKAVKRATADLAESEHELNILQRKQALDSDSYYSKTDYQSDTAGTATLDEDQQQIGDKKGQIEALKTKIAELQAEIEELGEPETSPPAGEPPR